MIRPQAAERGHRVHRQGGAPGRGRGLAVRGEKPERWIRQTDFSNDEAVGFLADRLNRLGVEERLLELGAVEGDPVLIGDPDNAVVFDFKPGIDAGAQMLGRRGEDQRFTEDRPAAGRRRAIDEAMPERGESEVRADVARRLDLGSDRRDGRGRGRRMTREAVTRAARVVVKVGSSSLTTAEGGIDPERVRDLVDSLVGVRERGADLVLVSSGAIAAGLSPLAFKRRPRDLARQQAAASVGQGLLVHRYTEEFARHGQVTGQVLLTVDDVTRRSHYRNAQRTFAKLLELGVVPIVNENDTVATSEIRFGDNDRLAALVAHLVHADLLAAALRRRRAVRRPARPGREPADRRGDRRRRARRHPHRQGRARPGSAPAACRPSSRRPRIATGAGIPVVLTDMAHARAALAGEQTGTLFHPTGRRRPTRLLWLAHATEAKGRIVLDDGAVRAVTERRASLLPAGITGGRGRLRGRRPGRPGRRAGPGRRPVGWSTTTPRSCPDCWAGPPVSWPASWARRTSARSCTATT